MPDYCPDYVNDNNYELFFPTRDIKEYAMLDGLPSILIAFTSCWWTKLEFGGDGSVLSYAVPANKNEILFLGRDSGNLLDIYIRNKIRSVNLTSLRVGSKWQHTCVTWSNTDGLMRVFFQGQQVSLFTNISVNEVVPNTGRLVIGQDQDQIGGGFSPADAFVGQLSDLNMWDHVLDQESISWLAKICGCREGNILRWSNVQFHLHGNLEARNTDCLTLHGRDCLDVLHRGHNQTGFYYIHPDDQKPFHVFCDQETNGGGWTLFQRRHDGSVDFNRSWQEYKDGFGNMTTEFWLGNDRLHRLTSQNQEILIELAGNDGSKSYAYYQHFSVSSEAENYKLGLKTYAGLAGDSLSEHNNFPFSTKDRDNNGYTTGSCAQSQLGAWWFTDDCELSNLNAQYAIQWPTWKGFSYLISTTSMKIRVVRARTWGYVVDFPENQASELIVLPKVLSINKFSASWWMWFHVGTPPKEWNAVFSLSNTDHKRAASFHVKRKGEFLATINSQRKNETLSTVFRTSEWYHLSWKWESENGQSTVLVGGQEKTFNHVLELTKTVSEGTLMIGESLPLDDKPSTFIFSGKITHFNMWNKFLPSSDLAKLASGCTVAIGNLVPWPEVQWWSRNDVRINKFPPCKISEKYRWLLSESIGNVIVDKLAGKRGVFHDSEVDTDLGVLSLHHQSYVDFGEYDGECLGNPELCNNGLSVSFWLNHEALLISHILGLERDLHYSLYTWISPLMGPNGKWSRCYRAAKHGWSSQTFHDLCDGRGSTLTLVKAGKYIFGGYLDQSWGGTDRNVASNSSFLFSIINADDFKPFKLNIKPEAQGQAAKQAIASGPVFGLDDLHIADRANESAVSFSDLGQSYQLPYSYLVPGMPGARRFLAGSYKFIAEDIEVFFYYGNASETSYILAAGGDPTQSPGLTFYHKQDAASVQNFSYHVTIATLNQRWSVGIDELPSFWTHVFITWSKAWGLKLYLNGYLVTEDNSYKEITGMSSSSHKNVFVGKSASSNAVEYSPGLQMSDFIIWDAYIPASCVKNRFENFGFEEHITVKPSDTGEFEWTTKGCNVKLEQGPCWTTQKDGCYFLMNSSYPRIKGDRARLVSSFIAPVKKCLSFQFLMNGETSGRLNVYSSKLKGIEELVWRLAGYYGDTWIDAQVPLDEHVNEVVFEGVVGNGFLGDITIINASLTVSDNCSFTPLEAKIRLTGLKSGVIDHIPSYQDLVITWLSQAGFSGGYWASCFRAIHSMLEINQFHEQCDNEGPFLAIVRKGTFIFGGFSEIDWKNISHGSKQKPASRSFLFSFKNFASSQPGTKLEVKPNMGHMAIQWNSTGPVFGVDDLAINLRDQLVTVRLGSAYESPDTQDVKKGFPAEDQFRPDDVEILVLSDTVCDPPCLSGEYCDEITGVCNCNKTYRDAKLCKKRRELQDKRDAFCNSQYADMSDDCGGPMHARFDFSKNDSSNRKWYCFSESALTGDRQRYNTSKQSSCYLERHDELLSIMTRDYPDLLLDHLITSAQYYWPIDHGHDARDTLSRDWAESSVSVKTIKGITGRALKFDYSSEKVFLLKENTFYCFTNLYSCNKGMTWMFWLRYTRKNSSSAQVFLSSAKNDAEDRGQKIFQLDGSIPHVTYQFTVFDKRCTRVVQVPENVWTHHAIVVPTGLNAPNIAIFQNGEEIHEFLTKGCVSGSFSNDVYNSLTVGDEEFGIPQAGIDEIIVWEKILSSEEIRWIFATYKGNFDMEIKLSLNLKFRTWSASVLNKESTDYQDIMTYVVSFVYDLYTDNEISSVQLQAVWEPPSGVGCNVSVTYVESGYDKVELLERAILLNSSMIELYSIESLDVYTKPLTITAHNHGRSTSIDITITWPGSNELQYGVLQGYQIFYTDVKLNRTYDVTVRSAELNHTIQNLSSYREYAITVRPMCLEGPGKKSEEIFAWTAEDAPLRPPGSFRHIEITSTSAKLTWNSIPEEEFNGIIRGYIIYYFVVNSGIQSTEHLNVTSPVTLQAELPGLHPYTNYSIEILAYTTPDKLGPRSPPLYFTTLEDVPSVPPPNVHAFNTSSTSLRVSWDPIPDNFSNGILQGYQVLLSSFDDLSMKVFISCNNLSVDIVELRKFTTYMVTVAGITTKGPGNTSYPVLVNTDEDRPEASSLNISLLASNASTLAFSWQPLSSKTSNGVILGYKIMMFDMLRNISKNLTINSVTPRAEISGLFPYTEYEVNIVAFNSKGEGNTSETFLLRTKESAPSRPPEKLSSNSKSSTGVMLTWEPVDKLYTNGEVRAYVIIFFETQSPDDNLQNVTVPVSRNTRRKRAITDSSSESFVLSGLKKFTTYTIQVLAYTVDFGVPSKEINITTEQDVPSLYPVNISAVNTSSTSINVTWYPVPYEHQNGIIQGYRVLYKEADNWLSAFNVTTVNQTSLMAELLRLTKFALYEIRVLAFTVVGNGNMSEPVFCRTDEDVPDSPPSNITAFGINTTILRVQWQPPVPRDRNGIILGYRLAVLNACDQFLTSYLIANGDTLSFNVEQLEIWTNYSVKMAAFTRKGDGPWSSSLRAITDEEAPKVSPLSVQAYNTSSTSLYVTWSPIITANLKGIHRSYRVYYIEQQTVFTRSLKSVTVDTNTLEVNLVGLYKFTNYSVHVVARTNKDGLSSRIVFAQTDEDKPDLPPDQVQIWSPFPTTLQVTWDEVPDGYRNGVIRRYKITHHELNIKSALVTRYISADTHQHLITGLKKFKVYNVTVQALTCKGEGAQYSALVMTEQDVPNIPPPLVIAESFWKTHSIPLKWNHIQEEEQNGVLIGYRVRYRAVQVGESPYEEPVKEKIIPPENLTTVLENLQNFAVYRIELSGFTIKGDGPRHVVFAETCRCVKRLTTNWMESKPYVITNGSRGNLSGLIPPFLIDMVVTCCSSCKMHGLSYADLQFNGKGKPAMQNDRESFRLAIDHHTDLSFPVYGFKLERVYKHDYGYVGIVESPGTAFIINTDTGQTLPTSVLMSVTDTWPLAVLCLLFCYIAGFIFWTLDSNSNSEQFRPSCRKGILEGLWLAFISMTTVGYGDRVPTSIKAKIFAIIWILVGLVINGFLISDISGSLTSISLETDFKLYGSKIAALEGSPEYNIAVRMNAFVDKAHDYRSLEDIAELLISKKVQGILVDVFTVGSRKDLFEKDVLRIHRIYDHSATYGVVTGGDTRKLGKCFNNYIKMNIEAIYDHLNKTVTPIDNDEEEPLEVERSSGLFDAGSDVFKMSGLVLSALFGFCLFSGTVWEVVCWKEKRRKVGSQEPSVVTLRKNLLSELNTEVQEFAERMRRTVEETKRRQSLERHALVSQLRHYVSNEDTRHENTNRP